VARRASVLTGDEVERLPGPCATCLFWELGTPCPDPRAGTVLAGGRGALQPSEPSTRKQAWVSARVQEGTPPGRVVVVDGEVVAYASFAPSGTYAPRRPTVPPASPDALLLATVWVRPVHREVGIGRLLVQAAIKEAIRLGAPALEAYGDRRWQERACVLPATWLLHEGFEVHREHLRSPLFRIDTKRTLRWTDSLEHAWEEVLGHLPRRVPAPERVPGGVPSPNAAQGDAPRGTVSSRSLDIERPSLPRPA
jgi:GNAT superfamily N-acetyltransferase